MKEEDVEFSRGGLLEIEARGILNLLRGGPLGVGGGEILNLSGAGRRKLKH